MTPNFFMYWPSCPDSLETEIPYYQKPLNAGLGIYTGVSKKGTNQSTTPFSVLICSLHNRSLHVDLDTQWTLLSKNYKGCFLPSKSVKFDSM